MKTLITSTLAIFAGIALIAATDVSAQEAAVTSGTTTKTAARKVGFRMPQWRTIHGDGTAQTTQMVATLKKIGCEVKQSDHGNHIDISYRCPTWKSVAVSSDKKTQEWQQWFASKAFETIVLNPSTTAKQPTVKARMSNWKTFHTHSDAHAQELKQTFELMGCEVTLNNHGNHIDTKVRCTEWVTIGFPNGKSAHVWLDWLNKSGFETQHEHSHE